MMSPLQLHNAPSNWFLTWDQQSSHQQKSFLLQVKLHNLSHRHLFSDVINSYVIIYRRSPPQQNWQEIGRTTLIDDDPNPQFPDAFRLCYHHQTDLSTDMLKLVCFNRRDVRLPSNVLLPNENVIGTANISIRELLRTFGTRVQVELVRKKTNSIVGSVWFLGEQLPENSPRAASNVLQFNISFLPLTTSHIHYHTRTLRLLLLIERQRQDSTWSVVYHSNVVKRPSVAPLITRNHPIIFKPFQVRQSELVLGMSPQRQIRFSFFQKGKRGHPHTCVGQVLTTTDELLNDFLHDTSLDLRINDDVVGEFACMSRNEIDKITSFDVNVDYFNMAKQARQIEEKRNSQALHLDSP